MVQCGSILKDLNHNPPNFQEGTLFILLLFFNVSLNQMHGATVFRNVFHSCFSNQNLTETAGKKTKSNEAVTFRDLRLNKNNTQQ